jgi:hypothetical protein
MPKRFSSPIQSFSKTSHAGALRVVQKMLFLLLIMGAAVTSYLAYTYYTESQHTKQALVVGEEKQVVLSQQLAQVEERLTITSSELTAVKSEDQFKKNQELMTEIKNIQTTYKDAVTAYNDLLKLKEDTSKPLSVG